jgi:hypothetical protein
LSFDTQVILNNKKYGLEFTGHFAHPCCAWSFCILKSHFRKRAFFGIFQKQKPPCGSACFLLDQWSWRESNPRPGKATICFLHAYPALIVGGGQVADSRTTPYLLCFHHQAGETIRLSLNCVRFLIGLVQGITARETSRPNTWCRD